VPAVALPSSSPTLSSVALSATVSAPPSPALSSTSISPSASPSRQSLSPVQFEVDNDPLPAEKSKKSLIKEEVLELQAIICKHQLTQAATTDLLRWAKKISHSTQVALPKCPKSMRPKPLPYEVHQVDPGVLGYIGICTNLRELGEVIFDPNATTIRLAVNFYGLPLFSRKTKKAWPILAKIEGKSVFLIGIYIGKKQPKCVNTYIRPFVKEVCQLQKRGIRLNSRTYRLTIHKLVMDAPARAFLLGLKSHGSRYPCIRCKVCGVRIVRSGLASTPAQKKSVPGKEPRQAYCYINENAPLRDVKFFYNKDLPACDPVAGCAHEGYWMSDEDDDSDVNDDYNYTEDIIPDFNTDHYNEMENSSPHEEEAGLQDEEAVLLDEEADSDLGSEEEESDSTSEYDPSEESFKHRTLLTKIDGLDLIRDVVLDIMHLIYLGVVKRLLELFIENECILSTDNKEEVNKFFGEAALSCPSEFQRNPESLEFLKDWKATQLRIFLLYVGAFALNGHMQSKYYNNFLRLVVVQ